MEKSNELVSVIIPIYNCECVLRKCIDSIVKQSYKQLEIILVDDGSHDNSGNICDEYSRNDSRVKAFHNDNCGVSIARNYGIENANGSYIMFVDADDWLDYKCIETLLGSMISNNVDVILGNINYISNKRLNSSIGKFESETLSKEMFITKYFTPYKTQHSIGGPFAKLFKKQLIDNFNMRYEVGETYAEDYCFNLKYYKVCKSFGFVDDFVYNYQVDTENSLSKSNIKKMTYIYQRQHHIMKLIRNFIFESKITTTDACDEFSLYFLIRDIRILFQTKMGILKKYSIFNSFSRQKYYICDINKAFFSNTDIFFAKVYIKLPDSKFLKPVNFIILHILDSVIKIVISFKLHIKGDMI